MNGATCAENFADLSARLVAAGYRVILPQPRGIGASTGALADLTLHDYANDIAAVIREVSTDTVTVVGHAWGNRLARMVATDHPGLVQQLVLVAAGGRAPSSPDIGQALDRAFDLTLQKSDHLAAVAKAFFAPGNDPAVWDGGWYPKTKQAQQAANRATPVDSWWAGGSVPILVVQGANDRAAPPANGETLLKEFGQRVTLVTVRLQMGFRTIAIEQRSAEVWQVLGAVKTEFGKFGEVLARVKDQLQAASNTIEKAETRTRQMDRALKTVEALPVEQSVQLLPPVADDQPSP